MAILYCGNQKIAPVMIEDSGGGSTPSGTTDVPLTRISDDTGNEIGTWYMNFADANSNVFKVIVLDAQYRNASTQWCSNRNPITNMPLYSDLVSSNVWEAGETATTNTQYILDYCTANSYSSTACSHCRSQSFTIGGVIYYGQLPNVLEGSYIARNYNSFDALDTSASSQSSLNFSVSRRIWLSNQCTASFGLTLTPSGTIYTYTKTYTSFACPVLEIPA